MKIAKIEWVDSCGHNGWVHVDPEEFKPCEIVSFGILIYETPEAVCISTSEDTTNGGHSDPMTIPRCAITSIQIEECQ